MPTNHRYPLPERTFGVELELKGLDTFDAERALEAVGLTTTEQYRDSQHWWPHHDGSLYGTACEVSSPVLKGAEGFRQLRKAVKALHDAGARPDKQCGLHVHIGVKEGRCGDAQPLAYNEAFKIVQRYAQFESEIDLFMPPSRRASRNCYCRTLDGFFDSPRTVTSWQRLLGMFDYEREMKVNVQAYDVHGTIEFRQHGGSMNYTKISNWVKFLLYFVEHGRSLAQEADRVRQANVSGDVQIRSAAREVTLVSQEDTLFSGMPSRFKDYFEARRAEFAAR